MAEYMKQKLQESRGSFDPIDPSKAEGASGGGESPGPKPSQLSKEQKMIDVGGHPNTRFARRFEKLGMANLLNLQITIHELEKDFERAEKINHANASKAFEKLMETLQVYNHALLEQRQVICLPKFDFKQVPSKDPHFQDLQTFLEGKHLWGQKDDEGNKDDFVSLDPCTCLPVCDPKGLGWLLTLPEMPTLEKRENPSRRKLQQLLFVLKCLGKFLLVAFFAILPAASILVLYVIPTSHKRLWAILGESGFLVCAFTIWKWLVKSESTEMLSYMLGIAAVQVIFVGSVIGTG